jgi:type II secretion system protein G
MPTAFRRLNMTQSAELTPVPAAVPRNGAAVASMVLGIIGVVLSVVIVGGVLGLVALILGIVGVNREEKKGMAVAGIVTGSCAMPLAFLALLAWAGFAAAMAGRPAARAARMHEAEADLAAFKTALMAFEVDNERYPMTGEGLKALVTCPSPDLAKSWTGPYIMKMQDDPWGHPFVYQGPEASKSGRPEVLSAGPDGAVGTKDDVAVSAGP